jgi:hypothetical protein
MRSSQSKTSAGGSISRRGFTSSSILALAAVALTSCMAVPAAFGMKISKQEAMYRDRPNGKQKCSGCVHFMNGQCSIVEGSISPNGWCKHFAAKA